MTAGDVDGRRRAPEATCRHCGVGIFSHGRSPTGWAHVSGLNRYRCSNGETLAQVAEAGQ